PADSCLLGMLELLPESAAGPIGRTTIAESASADQPRRRAAARRLPACAGQNDRLDSTPTSYLQPPAVPLTQLASATTTRNPPAPPSCNGNGRWGRSPILLLPLSRTLELPVHPLGADAWAAFHWH